MTMLSFQPDRVGDHEVIETGPSSFSSNDRLGRMLGWFSIGLGVAELAAAGRITQALGMEGKEGLVRAYGIREIVSGVIALSADREAGLWSRVAGDGLDLATLATGLGEDNPKRGNVGIALGMVAGVTLLDVVAASQTSRQHGRGGEEPRDYSDRSGFPGGVQAARGKAREDFETPMDMRAAPVFAP